MDIDSILKEAAFLSRYHLFQRVPKELISLPDIVRQYQGYVAATVRFAAYNNETVSIDEEVSISIPSGYPIRLPIVFILSQGTKINLGVEYHFYNKTGQLCLGNTWEVRKLLLSDPSLNNLMSSLVIPHIAGATFKCLYGKPFPQGEHAHNVAGIIEGLADFFSIPKNEEIILTILNFLLQSKRVANKMQCPFGCKKEYGKCHCKGDFQDLKVLFPRQEISIMIQSIEKHRFARQINHRS